MATIDDVAEKLAAHERIMQDRYEHLEKGIAEIKSAESAETETKMSTVNVENPMGGLLPLMMGGNWGGGSTAGAVGGGWGAGVLGGVLGGALLGNNGGLLGNRNGTAVGEGFVTPTQFQAGLNSVTAANDTTALMQGIGDLKTGVAGIPTSVALAEGQTQIALQNAQADLNRNIDNTGDQITAQISAAQLNNANNFAQTSRQLGEIIAASLASQNQINLNVSNQGAATRETVNANGTANLLATERAATATALAVANSTKEIIAALNAQDMANLQRQLTVAETTLAEQRATQRSRDVEVNVTQSVTQNQNQLQMQQQQQQQAIYLNNIATVLAGLQNAVATNNSMIIGNTGAVTSGAQTANPINVRN